jgi:hypothetical protein
MWETLRGRREAAYMWHPRNVKHNPVRKLCIPMHLARLARSSGE